MKTKNAFLATLILAALIPLFTQAASIDLSPKIGSFAVGQTFSLKISVVPEADQFDTVRANLNFTPGILEIKNFSSSPAFAFQAGSNKFDNQAGTFSWGAGIPKGTGAQTDFGTITFQILKPGSATVSVNNSSLVLSAGVNKFNGQGSTASYTLVTPSSGSSSNPAVKTSIKKNTQEDNSGNQLSSDTEQNARLVDVEVIPTTKQKDLFASLLDILPFKTAAIIALIIFIVLVALILRVLLQNKDRETIEIRKK